MSLDSDLEEREVEFFKEIYALIEKKYPGMENTFGMWRVHQHFDLSEEECLVESIDHEKKESALHIGKKRELPQEIGASTWVLKEEGPEMKHIACK